MPEEFKYQDKKVGKDVNDEGSLQNLVNKEFKKIENKNGIGYRDDQEIRNAGWNVCDTLINQIKKDKTMVYGPWALQPLTNLANTLKREHNAMKGMKLFTNNVDKINQIANRIDNAEKETLIRLQKNRTTQDSRDVVKKSEEKDKKNPMFTMELDNANKETGNIVFTKASNPVKIHTALEGLFDNTDKVYQIDYSNCTNQKIKSKMTELIGSQTCYLRYDKGQKTYTIRDKDGNGIYNRALIREGVKLIPDGVRKWGAYQEQKKIEENMGKEDMKDMDNNVRNMLKDMPSARNLNKDQQKNLFAKTDERILELLKKAKKLGYEIESECITKLYVKKGLMELHLISGTSETSRTFREDNSQLGSNLYDFLDGNEGEYKTYLTNRVKQKRQELDSLTKSETTDVEKKPGKNGQENSNEDESKKENEQQHKQQVLYGIGLLETMVNNYRESEGDSWLDNDDMNLVQIKQLIRNAKASIANANAIDDEVITSSFINPIRQKWALIKRISKTINSGQGQTYENPSYKQQYNQLKKVFFGSNNEQIDAIRDLGGFGRLFDKTETSFLQQEIENNSFNEEGENLEVKYTKVNECIQKIYNYKVELSQEAGDFDESGNLSPAGQEKVKELDNLYEKAKLEKSEFANYLSSIGLLPPNWKTKNKMVLKAVESLQNKLNNTQKQLDNFAKTKDNLSEEQHIKKLKLEQKENKTEEDLKELQALEYLEQNTEERDRINEVTLNMMKIDLKYGGINQLLGSSLFESLTELGGGAVGNNSKVYNDIIGYGFRNASDENAKLAGEIATEIAITVAVCVVTGGAGAGAIAAMLNVGSKAARATKWVRLANNIQKLVRLNNLGMKGFRIANTAGKISMLTTHAAGLLIEGTVFNAATNTIHSAMNGTSLDSLNLNPTAKENVQTAAFLGALSISGRLTQGLMKAGGKTKLSINLMKGLEKAHLQAPAKFTTGLVTEMGSMLAAEQTINFVFGHDIVNPETGEIEKSRKPELPTQQELTQMIGMILAFKMVKPGLWQQYTQKLNEGTLEICRSVKANEILVRNPKTGEIVERINQDSINGNNKETETKSITEKPKDSLTKDREAIRKRQEELMNKKQSHEKRKAELNKRKAELERRKSELLAQREANWRSLDGRENNIGRIQDVLKKGHIITIDGLKYKFNGIKNGKAEFIIDGNAKKSAETSGKSYSEKVEVSSLEELLSSHFNLEPGNKGTNSGRYAKLNELIGEKVEPLDRLQNKIRNKKAEIKTLEEEIARLEKGNNTIAKNDYFEQHKNEIIGKNVRIDGVKYRAEQINKDGTIQFKEVDGSDHFTVSSFKQLAEKGQVNGFSDGLKRTYDGKEVKREKIEGSESLKEGERKNHEIIRNLISGESEYLSSRNTDQTLNQKRANLQSAQQELKGLEDKLPASQTRQQAISERARRGEELNKELGKLETELNGVNRELGEADRLVKKYQDEIDGIEKELPTEQQPKEREVVKPDIEGNVSPESVQKTLTQKEILSESMGSDLHEEWRKGRLKEDGTYEPRIKETKDAEWISKNGTNQVDIANTKFEDLPSDWKYENLEAAKVAVDLVYEKILKGESISPKALEEMSSKVHEERLKRNSWAKGGELDVPYDKLPEVEKAKDRNQVLQAIEKVGGKEKRVGTENLFNNYRKGLQEAPQIKNQETKQPTKQETKQPTTPEGIIQVNGVTPEWGKNLQTISRGEFYENGILKKGQKYLENGLTYESGEYDINGNMIKGEKYKYNAGLYNHEGMPIEGIKTTIFVGHEYLVSKEGRINRLGNYKNSNRGNYEYRDGSKFSGEVDKSSHPKQGKLTLQDGTVKEGSFIEGQLKSGIEISNNGGNKRVKFIGNVDLNFIKSQTNSLGEHLASGEMMEIETPNGLKIIIKNIEGDLVEWGGTINGVNFASPIEGKLGDYIQNKIKIEAKRKADEEAKRKTDEEAKRKTDEEAKRKTDEEAKRKANEEQDNLDIDVQVLSSSITESQLNTLRSLNKGKNERIYLDEFGEPKNVISLGNGENLYVSDCLELNGRKFIVGYVQKGGEMKLRLFYRSKSEGARRSCPGERADGGYSKGENILNSSYETTTRVLNELQHKFDNLPTQKASSNPITLEGTGYNILEREMASEIKIDKLFNGLNNNTVDYIKGHTVAEVKDMYRRLGVGIDTSGMKIVEGKGYTYEHQYLGTIEVKVCRLNYNGKDLDFSFSKVKNDPQNRVRIEEVNYADAKVSSFGIYDKQINAAPLTGKPIDYANERHWQVPKDQNGTRYGGTYMDIRDLYQENPIIKRFKELSQIDNTYTSAA